MDPPQTAEDDPRKVEVFRLLLDSPMKVWHELLVRTAAKDDAKAILDEISESPSANQFINFIYEADSNSHYAAALILIKVLRCCDVTHKTITILESIGEMSRVKWIHLCLFSARMRLSTIDLFFEKYSQIISKNIFQVGLMFLYFGEIYTEQCSEIGTEIYARFLNFLNVQTNGNDEILGLFVAELETECLQGFMAYAWKRRANLNVSLCNTLQEHMKFELEHWLTEDPDEVATLITIEPASIAMLVPKITAKM